MAAAPSIGRAAAVEAPPRAHEAELTHSLYERYSHQLYGFCYAKLGSREEAEDAVQTTFLNAFRGLARGVVPQAESAWLFKIAENVCLSRHRSSFRRRRVESPCDFEVLQDVVPAREHDGDELVGLERVLGKMPESQRRAILLREWQGLSYREIATEMELTQAAVETLIFRARRSLAHGLESLEQEGDTPLRRVRRGADAGGLVAALKTFLGTAAGMKAAATVAAVGSATVIAATPPSVRHEFSAITGQSAEKPQRLIHHAVAHIVSSSAAAGPAAVPQAAAKHHPSRAPLAARHAPGPGLASHRAAPVESALAAASAAAPAPTAAPAAPQPAAVAAPAPIAAPVPQPEPAAPAPDPAAAPRSEAPVPAAAPSQPATPVPAPDKGDDGKKDKASGGGSHGGGGDQQQGSSDSGASRQKKNVQAALPAQNATTGAPTTASVATTTTVTTQTATTATSATPPSPAAAPPAATTPPPTAPEQGHRRRSGGGDAHGGGDNNH